MEMHNTRCWLVNTGWSGGPYGVGRRLPVDLTRTLVRAALSGALDNVSCNVDPYFRFLVPVRCPGVSESLLDAQERWSDPVGYDKAARRLAKLFEANLALYK
jgi:phosphoenolpyruvate carboxykinase (ATP)